ncbi:MAG: hypothetical protein EOO61_17215 [Hymenobacter sp.]|jgi:hypothetical protein|nr:MAG: hypothetical protein EOO61_17215 [Hymenobacter sp.]
MSNNKKSSKGDLIGNMRKSALPLAIPSTPTNDLVYGTPESVPAPAFEVPEPIRRIVFTNELTPERYAQVQQYKYWGRLEIREIIDQALEAFFADKPDANRTLPEKEAIKLSKKLRS